MSPEPPPAYTTRCPECGAEFRDPEPLDAGNVRDTVTCRSGHTWTVLDEGGAGNVREFRLGPASGDEPRRGEG